MNFRFLTVILLKLIPRLIIAHKDSTVDDVSFWTQDSYALSCWECFNNRGKICHDNENDNIYEYDRRRNNID